MTEAQRIDLIAQLYEIYIRAIHPVDHTKQQCAPAPDWMHQQCRNLHPFVNRTSQIVNPND